jgi:hypothetical protein
MFETTVAVQMLANAEWVNGPQREVDWAVVSGFMGKLRGP